MAKRASRVLTLHLEGMVAETRPTFLGWGGRGRPDLGALIDGLKRVREDRRFAGVLVHWRAAGALSGARAASLGRALGEIQSAGKLAVAFIERISQIEYAVAARCGIVMMAPGTTLPLVGLRAEALFFQDLLEVSGLSADVLAVGDFKSAGEALTRRDMSPSHREQMTSLLGDLTNQLVEAITDGRRVTEGRARTLLQGGPYLAEEAVTFGLVDRVGHVDEAEALFEEKLGARPVFVPHRKLRVGESVLRRLLSRRPQVALVHLQGIIGAAERQGEASEGRRALLKRLRESPRVKAVVLRIDSPGGDAVASELLWREVSLIRQAKPVVASMGDVAASGGYYVACAADSIVAEASTLTGSIGVVGGKLVSERLLAKLGIRRESVSSGPRSGFFSTFEPWSDEDRNLMKRYLEHFYEKLFLPRVVEGRRLSPERARELSGGRVWTGRQGKENGLVDAIGDTRAAIELARVKAGLHPSKFRVVSYREKRRLTELIPWSRRFGVFEWGSVLSSLLDAATGTEAFFLMPWWIRIR